MLLTCNISPFQLLFYPSKEARDVQTHQEQYQLLCLLCLPLGQADLVSLLDKLKLFYSAFSTSAPKHKSTIFGSFITRRFYTFRLLFLFNTIRFHHYYIFMLYKNGLGPDPPKRRGSYWGNKDGPTACFTLLPREVYSLSLPSGT